MNLSLSDIGIISGIVGSIVVFAGFILKIMIENSLLRHRLKLVEDMEMKYVTREQYERDLELILKREGNK